MSKSIQRLLSQVLFHAKPSVPNIQYYSRWTHRQPGKVILPFEPTGKVSLKKEKVIDLDPSVFKSQSAVPKSKKNVVADQKEQIAEDKPDSTIDPQKSKKIKSDREEKLKKRKFYLSQKKVFDDNGEIMYEKLNNNDGRAR